MQIVTTPYEFDLFGINQKVIGYTVDGIQPNHRVECEVFAVNQLDEERSVIILENTPLEDGVQYFNISEVFDFSVTLPPDNTFTSYSITSDRTIHTKYRVELREYYGQTSTILQDTKEVERYAYWGGRETIANRTFDFMNFVQTDNRLLTLQPNERLLLKKQPEFISHLTTLPNAQCSIQLNLSFSDGSTQLVDLDSFSSSIGSVLHLGVGYEQLNLASYETGKYLLSYTVKIVQTNDTETTSSETINYIIDFSEKHWGERFYLFKNSMGGLDVVCSRGKSRTSAKIQQSSRQRVEGISATPSRHRETASKTSSKVVEVNLGWLNYPNRRWLLDLQISPFVWEMDLKNQTFIPIRVIDSDFPIHKDDEPLQDASFSYQYTESRAI